MRNAPSVTYPVGRCAFSAWLFLSLAGLTLAIQLLWWWWQRDMWLSAWVLTLWGMAVAQAWRANQIQGGQLTWDEQVWCWHDAPHHEDAMGRLQVLLDVQHTLLLRWQPSDVSQGFKSVNLWLSAQSAPDFWQDLRRAVYAHDNR